MSVQDVLRTHWPVIATVGAGLLAWGALNADVTHLKDEMKAAKAEITETQKEARTDHDLLVELNTRSQGMEDDMKEIKTAVKELAGRRAE